MAGMPRRRIGLLSLLVATLAGCVTPVGASGGYHVDKQSGSVCSEQCAEIGMQLSAVAIMANNVGCVCQPAARPQAAVESAPAAGMATIMLIERARQAQQAQQASMRR